MLGIIENMSGFVCPECGEEADVMEKGGGKMLAEELEVPYLGHIPLDPRTSESSDIGVPYVVKYPDSPASKQTVAITDRIVENIAEFRKQRGV
jgi:ATP-binding protein involved in chromosome partitioning